MKARLALLLALLLLILALPAAPIQAQGGAGVTLTDRYVLNSGQTVGGDLFVAAQTILLQLGSQVTGDVALFGEQVAVHGVVSGDLAVMAREIILGPGAVIEGDASLCGETIRRTEGATVQGAYSAGCDGIGGLLGDIAPLAFDPGHWTVDQSFDPTGWEWDNLDIGAGLASLSPTPLQRLGWGVGWSLAMAAAAALCALIFPQRLRRISDTVLSAPLASGGLGLLSMILAVVISGVMILSLVLVITVILLPLLGLLWLAVLLALVVGWAALSLPVGTWLLTRMRVRRITPMAAAAVGALALTFAVSLLGVSPLTALLGCGLLALLWGWGLGAVLLTCLGRYPYPHPYPRHSAGG